VSPLFEYNTDCFGGTEYMARGAHRFLGGLGKFSRFSCFVIPGRAPQAEDFDGTPLIFWMHNPLDQLSTEVHDIFRNHRVVESIAFIVVPSQWLKDCLLRQMDVIRIDPEKIIVIPNATDPIPSDLSRFSKKVDKPILVHASRQERGMEVLIPAAHLIEEDFELKIFNDFYPDTAGINDDIRDIVRDPRFTFYGDTPRDTVMRHIGEAHIHAYPAYWEETSCMVQIESLTSGLLTVVSDVAALPETSQGFSMKVPFADWRARSNGGREQDIANFSYSLSEAIRIVQSGLWIPAEQVAQTREFYSWEKAEERWTAFHDSIA
jgi:glycosyltransferase involved in cell wall biosynthesis